ncbi:MAG: site-specific DNA-methyltransferase [Pseudomonadota bacterium]|nr:site-specific DNA-methyltransferase [Pseudomonadota bacterium]
MNAQLYGVDMFGGSMEPKPSGPVAERFGFSPFTVLDAKQGDWQERKRAWASIGIRGEIGRGVSGRNSTTGKNTCMLGADDGVDGGGVTSIFDPVLCEMAFRWFSGSGAQVVDPFAGGSVRGIVAASLGRKYWGCDLRAEQIAANRTQADAILDCNKPVWVCGDSMDTLDDAPAADFVFSCPPYGDLEVYSDDPADLSSMEWHTFVAAYKRIIMRAVGRLKDDRFACFVVGDFRDNKGFYRDFVSTTIRAFEECGARLYNEAILATPVGSACMRVTKQFDASRKMAKTHQNVLVFCKGDPRKAAQACKA